MIPYQSHQLNFNLSYPDEANHYEALKNKLPHGTWPTGAITEIFYPTHCEHALNLVLPTLAQFNHADKWLAWVSPPKIARQLKLDKKSINHARILQIYPHPTTNGLWAVEKALRSPTCGAVMSWVTDTDSAAMKRLEKAAREGDTCGILFRPDSSLTKTSQAALRLKIELGEDDEDMYLRLL